MSPRDRADRIVTAVGVALLGAYLAQAALGLEVPTLVALQADDTYKVVSGIALSVYVLVQWLVVSRRVFDPRAVTRHKLYGALAPAVLYLHATRFGYGYLAVLAAVYLGVVLLGLGYRGVVRTRRLRVLFTSWFVAHVALSVILVLLGCYHLAIALAYE